MSGILYADEQTGSEIREADGGSYQVVDGDGREVAVVEPEQADEIASLMSDLADPDTTVDGAPGPEGDGWKLGQLTHPLFGAHGLVFFDPSLDGAEQREQSAEFEGGIDLAETFAEVFGGE